LRLQRFDPMMLFKQAGQSARVRLCGELKGARAHWLLFPRIALAIKGFSEISYGSERPCSTIELIGWRTR